MSRHIGAPKRYQDVLAHLCNEAEGTLCVPGWRLGFRLKPPLKPKAQF